MKRIEAILNGKMKDNMTNLKEKQVIRILDNMLNDAQEKIEYFKDELDKVAITLNTEENIPLFLKYVGSYITAIEEQEDSIKFLEKIKEYFNEDINVE